MRLCFGVIVILLLALDINAQVALKPTPVQTQFESLLFSSSGGDDFLEPVDQLVRTDRKRQEKSVFKAAAYSFLLPGLGEYYMGNRSKANYFFGAEAMTWIAFVSFRVYGGWRENDYVRFAAEKAGAQIENKDDKFRSLLALYEDIDQYNTLGRALEPSSPYYVDNAENHWRWQSTDDRVAYRILRDSSRNSYKRSDWMIVAALINRVVSVVDAVRDAKQYRNNIGRASIKTPRSLKFSFDPLSDRSQIRLTYFTGG